MLDAPVSGSAVTLDAGQLSVMVGGDYEVYEAMKPILQDIGPTVDYVGENGLAATMKVAVNLSLPIQILSFCGKPAAGGKERHPPRGSHDGPAQQRGGLPGPQVPLPPGGGPARRTPV